MFVFLLAHLICLFVQIVECAAFICIDTLVVTVVTLIVLSENNGCCRSCEHVYKFCLKKCLSIDVF